jgi:endonuclease G
MRIPLAIAAFVAALLALGCDPGCRGGEHCALQHGDTTPPTAALEAPSRRVAGTVALTAHAEDDVGVVSVDFAVDGRVFASARQPPWNVRWNSLSADNGAHSLSAIAWDAAGNAGTSASVPISVLNAVGGAVSIHTALGLPGPASSSMESLTAYLSVKPQYVLSYDGVRRAPNWVGWELNAQWLGDVARQNDFRPDDTLPEEMPQAQVSDYAGSGWDRGHLCPSEDRTATVADNRSTFYLTNMVPQADAVNTGPWERLEAYLRQLAAAGKEIFVVAGGVFSPAGKTIGADAVAVPWATFKVAVVLDSPGQGIADVSSATRVISVLVPNDASVPRTADWRSYRVSAREVEKATGFTLFADVPHEVREVLLDAIEP